MDTSKQIDFIKHRKLAMFGSLSVNILILVSVFTVGLNMGVDFAGGSEIEAGFKTAVSAEKVRESVEKAGFKEPTVQQYGTASDHAFLIRIGKVSVISKEQAQQAEAQLKAAAGDAITHFGFDANVGDEFQITTKSKVEDSVFRQALESKGIGVLSVTNKPTVDGQGFEVQITTRGIADRLEKAFRELDGTAADATAESDRKLRRIDYVGPQVGAELRNQGIMAVLYAMGMILLYVFLRFDFRFAPGGVVALLHDVIVVLGYFVVSRREFNLVSLSALLTVVGYSMNDTIVVYDRIRENMGKFPKLEFPALINLSINETLTRTILTSGVTALSLIGLLVYGVGSIWDFAAAMMVGIITGTYSSIYIASPVTIWIEEQQGHHKHLSDGTTAAV